MKKIIFILTVIALSLAGYSQTVKKTKDGNFIEVKTARTDSVNVIETGKFYTDLNGVKFPVYSSNKGKLFIMRISKNTGKPYKFYLKIAE